VVVLHADIFSQEETFLIPLVAAMRPRWPLHGGCDCRKHKIYAGGYFLWETVSMKSSVQSDYPWRQSGVPAVCNDGTDLWKR